MKLRHIALPLFLLPASAMASNATWDTATARAGGTGCPGPWDTFFVSSGNEADVIFNNFQISLTGNGLGGSGTSARAELKNCRVDFPLWVRKGVYLANLEERLDFGVIKSYASTGALDSRAWFYGWPLSRMTIPFGYGVMNAPTVSRNRTSTWSVYDYFCSHPDPNGIRGIYINMISMSGQRANTNESIVLATQGLNLKWHIVAALRLCR